MKKIDSLLLKYVLVTIQKKMEYNTIFENINVNVKVGEDSDEDEYTCEYCTTTQDHNWCFRCNTENICESCNGHGGDYGENEEWVCDNCLPTCLECGKQLFVRGDECCEKGRSDITEEEEDVMSKPILSRTYTLGMGACDAPENGGISEIQKILVMKNQEEEEDGIGCNECYACVTGGAGPCVKDKE
jgi:hypothetical protein